MRITEPVAGIVKFEVPFEDIYTAVFAVSVSEGYVLIDAATTAQDVDRHILPALRERGFSAPPAALLLTHAHGDHAGGAPRLHDRFPHMPILAGEPLRDLPTGQLTDGAVLLDTLQVLHLPGHSRRSLGFLHLPTDTLISGDCLQQRGVGRYRRGIGYPQDYLRSIARLRQLPLRCILASHDYDPLGSVAMGVQAVAQYLSQCEADCPQNS